MILPQPRDAIHRGQLFRLLIEIADSQSLSKTLIFKGGTCAAMQGALDRFSVDLDFDIKVGAEQETVRDELGKVYSRLGFIRKDISKVTVQDVLKYEAPQGVRNTLKLDAIGYSLSSSEYLPVYLADIDRYMLCQTIETMFAHKLVAVLDRYSKHESIAGRDIYDIHYFFTHQYTYTRAVIEDRTKVRVREYLAKLLGFIQEHVTQRTLNEDLNTLLPQEKYENIRKSLKIEVIAMLKAELMSKT